MLGGRRGRDALATGQERLPSRMGACGGRSGEVGHRVGGGGGGAGGGERWGVGGGGGDSGVVGGGGGGGGPGRRRGRWCWRTRWGRCSRDTCCGMGRSSC